MNHFFESFHSSKISLKNFHILFYQYQQMNGQLSYPESLSTKQTTTKNSENTGVGERQAQQCGEVKLVSDILW